MPKSVVSLKKIGKKVLRILSEHVELPPVIEKIKELVTYCITVFNDIKDDIMKFYNVSKKSILLLSLGVFNYNVQT